MTHLCLGNTLMSILTGYMTKMLTVTKTSRISYSRVLEIVSFAVFPLHFKYHSRPVTLEMSKK